MRILIAKWTVGSVLIATVLAGAYRIIQMNQAAMAGSPNGKAPAFYGH
jgi:hypothetical protein